MAADYILTELPSARGEEKRRLLSVRAGCLYTSDRKKDGNNGDNGLTYGRRGIWSCRTLIHERTIFLSARCIPARFTVRGLFRRPVHAAVASNRDSVHSPLISSEEGRRWKMVARARRSAPRNRSARIASFSYRRPRPGEQLRVQPERQRESSYFIFLHPDSPRREHEKLLRAKNENEHGET